MDVRQSFKESEREVKAGSQKLKKQKRERDDTVRVDI